jgi:hypothetical protein
MYIIILYHNYDINPYCNISYIIFIIILIPIVIYHI